MKVFSFDSANELLFELASKEINPYLDSDEKLKVASTGANSGIGVVEVGRCHLTLTDPTKCLVTLSGRKNNLPAVLGEILMVLSGSSYLEEWLLKMVPNLSTFSDDGGYTWRGAYGPRLMEGQLEHAFTQLRLDINTRKSVAMIADPTLDSVAGYVENIGTIFTKDNICNLGLVFNLNKEGKLDCTVLNRSNDLIWGLSNVNIAEFSIILIIMSSMIGVEVGNLHVFTTNLHSYVALPSIKDQIREISEAGDIETSLSKEELVKNIVFNKVRKYSSWVDVKNHAGEIMDQVAQGSTTLRPECLLSSIGYLVMNKVNEMRKDERLL